MSRWFRFYEGALDDPKVQTLPADDFKSWVNILCVACRNDGILPSVDALAFMLRMESNACRTLVERLVNAGLIDRMNGGPNGSRHAPHGWNKRQYKSDTSTKRVKRFRERSEAVTETPPDTETDTDTERGSETNVSGAVAPTGGVIPIDARTALFRDGLSALRSMTGKSDGQCRQLVGKWLKVAGDDAKAVHGAIQRASDLNPAEPIAWIEKTMRPADPDAMIYRGVL